MINIIELKELIKIIDQSSINEFEFTSGEFHINLKKAPAGDDSTSLQWIPGTAILETARVEAAVSNIATEGYIEENPLHSKVSNAATSNTLQEINSNWVGLFVSSVTIGEQIKKGQVVCRCHVDRLQLSHDITSQISGEIVDILVEDGQLIEFGQPLFVVEVDPRRTEDV